jgi:GAF domain-containing protein/two-component sensor histidine kinase
VRGALGVFLDITERKRAEQERAELLRREQALRGEAEQALQLQQSIERQLMLLVEASGTLLASPESGEVLRTILSLAGRFVEADAYAVWRKSHDGQEWHVVAEHGLSDRYKLTVANIPGNSAHLSSEPVAVEDVEQSPFVGYRKKEYEAEGIKSMLTVPLRIHGQIAGTIVFYYRSPHRFTPVETRVAGALGNLAAAALGTADLYRREMELRSMAQAAESRARFVAQAGEMLSSSLEYETTLRSVAKLAIPTFADWCAVDINQDGQLERVTVEHADPAMIEFAAEYRRKYPPRAEDLTQTVFLTGQPVLIEDIPEELVAEQVRDPERFQMVRALRVRSLIMVPMVARGKSLGLMTFAISDAARRYKKDDLALAEDLARRAAIAIDNAMLYSEVRSAVMEREDLLRREQTARETAEVLNRVGPLLSVELDSKRLVEKVTDLATRLIGAEFGALFHNVVNESGESYTLYTLAGTAHEAFARFPMPRNTAVFGPTFRGEGPLRSDDITADLRYGKNAPYHGMPDGHPPVRSYLAVPVVSRSGEVLGGLFFGHSATGVFTKRSEELVAGIAAQAAIALDNARLFSQSEQAQTALRQSNEELQRANEDLNQFAYSASHDLQEPLRMVALYSQMLQRKYHGKLDAQANEFIAYTVQGASRLEMLVKDLLAYTQAANFATGEVAVVDANQVIDSTLQNLRQSIEENGALVTHDVLPAVAVQKIHLVQLFQNLISNALKYRGNKPPRVAITAERANSSWTFSVQDNGIGIDPQYKEQIFGLFKRLHTTADYAGTGIGLAICQKIVERYGGSIWVESTLGEGSTFHFTIPDRATGAA